MMIQNLWEEAKAAQEARKFSNKQPNLTPKGTREKRTNNTKVSRRKQIIIKKEKKNRKDQ